MAMTGLDKLEEILFKTLPVINLICLIWVIWFMLFHTHKEQTAPSPLVVKQKLIPVKLNISPSAAFEAAVQFVLSNEGGYTNLKEDKGGETKFGISTVFHPGVDIESLTEAKAIEIFKANYWDGTQTPFILDAKLRTKFFDASVLIGNGSATRCMQRALRATGLEVMVDGVFGKKTLHNVNTCTNSQGLQWAFIGELAHYFEEIVERDPVQKKFILGWLNRAYDVVE